MARKKIGKKGKSGGKICPEGKAWARRTFDTYPSAYANLAASKYCKDPNYAKKAKGGNKSYNMKNIFHSTNRLQNITFFNNNRRIYRTKIFQNVNRLFSQFHSHTPIVIK